MTKAKIIFFIFLLMSLVQLAHAQVKLSQNVVLTWGMVREFLTLPFELLSHLNNPSVNSENKKLQAATEITEKNKTSECSPWNNSTGNCQCKVVCPDSYSILEKRNLRENVILVSEYNPLKNLIENREILEPIIHQEDTLSFLNEDEDFKAIHPRTIGYCWGHSHLWRRLHTLAFFNPSASKENIKVTRKKIRKIFYKGKPQVFPGYSSIYDLSNDPEVKKILLHRTVKEWRKHAIDVDSMKIYFKKKISAEKLKNFVSELKLKLHYRQNPIVFFKHSNDNTAIHIVPVYRLQEISPNVYKMCFLDNHGTVEEQSNCGHFVNIDLNKAQIGYGSWVDNEYDLEEGKSNLNIIGFTPEDVSENVMFVKNLNPICRKQTLCQ